MLLEELKDIVGPKGWVTDEDALHAHVTEWRGAVLGATPMMVMPQNTAEVAAVVRACAASNVAIVPQGGNTGMCAGAVPDNSGTQIILALSRMNRIRNIDAENYSMEVEAGCLLQSIRDAAKRAGRHFALSLSAEGSCQIGGNLSTNAGGINVLRYGTARAQILGLEVVLADGTIVESLRALRKDTAGYDLKQLFIGSEGTLGIITAAVLKLQPDPGQTDTALIGLNSSGAAVRLLAALRTELSDAIEAFELVSEPVFALVERQIPGASLPFEQRFPWYVLIETATGDVQGMLESVLIKAVQSELIVDAVVAKNSAEAERFWRLRHSISEAERHAGEALKHDISVPVSKIETFLERGDQLLQEQVPGGRLFAFGHVGDGNLHYNVMCPPGFSRGDAVTTAVYDLVMEFGGSISAEHGIGQVKKKYLLKYRSDAEIELMKTLKRALDPANLLNRGKVIGD